MPPSTPGTPQPIPDALCALLPFAAPTDTLTTQLLQRADAAQRHRTELTAAEHAALNRLTDALTTTIDLELAIERDAHQAIASRVLAYTPGDIVVALLWRDPNTPHPPYAVQLARVTSGTTTLLEATAGLRVDKAWPLYRRQRWP